MVVAVEDFFARHRAAWNRLVTVKDADDSTLIAAYEYDGLNRRTLKEVYASGSLDEVRHFYYNDQWQCLEERVETTGSGSSSSSSSAAGTATPDTQYVWGPRYIDDLVLRDRDTSDPKNGTLNERLYALQDPNWNVVALAQPNGTIAQRFTYDAYGKPTSLNPNFTTYSGADHSWPYLFTTRRLDAETALMHYRNRYYDTRLGRFVTRDPFGYEGSIWNLYEYAESMPVFWADSYGLAPGWSPEDCPTTCKDSDWDKKPVQSALKEREKEIIPPGGDKSGIKFIRTIKYRSDCGAGGLSLTCMGYRKRKGKTTVRVIICIQTLSDDQKNPHSACDAMAALEHEAVHAQQVVNYLNGKGKNPLTNMRKAEEEAWRKQCEIEADQTCLDKKCPGKGQKSERDKEIDKCVKKGVALSTGGGSAIGRGCAGLMPRGHISGLPNIPALSEKIRMLPILLSN